MAVMLETPSLAQSCSEPELIAAARDGDDRAFEELYARYHDRIGTFILGRVRDHGRAEDIAQEVFMSALRRMRASDQSISFKPWIYEIAKNACIDEFRRCQRIREVSLDADEELTGGPRALHSVTPTPPAAVEGKQRMEDLRGAFGGLSENHHKLLVMRELEGLSYEEIGRRTGMSRQMVESTLFRARRKLTAEYEELASGRRCQQIESLIADGRAQSARALGARERRQLARHLAHCQPCRMTARVAGVDEALFRPRSIAAKIAALLPFPLWRWLSRRAARGRNAATRAATNPVAQQVQNAAAATDSTGPAASLGGAAIAAAVIALAGAGGAVVVATDHHASPTVVRAGHVTAVRNGGGRGHNTSLGGGASTHSPSHSATTVRRFGSTPGARASHAGAAGHGVASSAPGGSGGTANTPPAGSPSRTVSGVAGGASHVTQTAAGQVSQVARGAGSTLSHPLKTVDWRRGLDDLRAQQHSQGRGLGGRLDRQRRDLDTRFGRQGHDFDSGLDRERSGFHARFGRQGHNFDGRLDGQWRDLGGWFGIEGLGWFGGRRARLRRLVRR